MSSADTTFEEGGIDMTSNASGKAYYLIQLNRGKHFKAKYVCDSFTKRDGTHIRFKSRKGFQNHINNVG